LQLVIKKQSTIFETNLLNSSIIEDLVFPLIGSTQNNPDYYELKTETKQSIGIKETKEMINWLQLKPFQHTKKVGLILEGDKLTTEAQNLLLKTFEEPPSASYIIIVSRNHKHLLPTIISRGDLLRSTQAPDRVGDPNTVLYLNNPLEEKIKFIDSLYKMKDRKDRKDSIFKLLEDLYAYTQKQSDKEKQLHNFKLIEKSLIAVKRNVNMKLVLENLFFNFKN